MIEPNRTQAAITRAARIAGNAEEANRQLSAARQFAAQIADPDERSMLDRDLDELA